MTAPRLKRFYALAISIGLAMVFLAVSLIVPVVGTATDFSIYNTGWNGTSNLAVRTYEAGKFVPTLEVRNTGTFIEPAIVALDKVDLDPATSSIVIIGPTKSFSDADGVHVSEFLARGGTVLIADDFGTGNTLLRNLNTTSRFTNTLIADLAFEKSPEFAVAYNFADDSEVTDGIDMVLLNYPSSISPSPNAAILASSSDGSWGDTDGDLFRDDGETAGPFHLLTVETIGKGELMLLSDPSLLINSMYEYLDNSALVDNILAFVSEGKARVLIDESHRSFFDPLAFSSRALAELSSSAKLLLVVIIITAFFLTTTNVVMRLVRFTIKGSLNLWARFVRMFSKEERLEEDTFMSDKEILSRVMERHPDWNKGVLSRLLRQVGRHGAEEK